MDKDLNYFTFRSFWNLLKNIWEAFLRNPWIYFLILISVQGIGFYLLYFIISFNPELLKSLESGNFASLQAMSIVLLYQLIAVLLFINCIFSTAIQLLSYWAISSWKKKDITGSYQFVRKKCLGLFWVNLLCMIIIYLGFVMMVLPSIIFAYLLFASGAIYLIEGTGGFKALKRSIEVMKIRGKEIIFNAGMVWLFVSIITSFYVDLPYRLGQIIASGFTSFWFFGAIYLIIYNEEKNLSIKKMIK